MILDVHWLSTDTACFWNHLAIRLLLKVVHGPFVRFPASTSQVVSEVNHETLVMVKHGETWWNMVKKIWWNGCEKMNKWWTALKLSDACWPFFAFLLTGVRRSTHYRSNFKLRSAASYKKIFRTESGRPDVNWLPPNGAKARLLVIEFRRHRISRWIWWIWAPQCLKEASSISD